MAKALPRAPDASRPRTATQIMLFGMFEAMTTHLRRGHPVDAETSATIEGLLSRADALSAAYTARVSLIDGEN